MSSFTITTVTAPSTPFELVSGLWHGFIGLKPFADFKRSRQRPGVRDGRLDLTHMTNIVALGNWLAQLQASMNRHGLCVSELVLVLWVLQCLEPGTRSFLERSLATEQEPEKVGFNTLKLHLEVWARVLTTREHRRHWNKVTQGSVDLVEFWAGQGAQKHAELVRRWKHAWGVLSGEHGIRADDRGTTVVVAFWKRQKNGRSVHLYGCSNGLQFLVGRAGASPKWAAMSSHVHDV